MTAAVALVALWSAGDLGGRASPSASSGTGPTGYLTEVGVPGVTRIDLGSGRLDRPLDLGVQPLAVAVAPDRRTLYVVDVRGGDLIPVSLGSGKPGTSVGVGQEPLALAVAPDGRTAYVADEAGDEVVPVNLSDHRAGTPIPVGEEPTALAVAPDDEAVFVVNGVSDTVTPIATSDDTAGSALDVGVAPSSITVAPDATVAFVGNQNSQSLTPISLEGSGGRPGRAIPLDLAPTACLAVSAGTVYVGGIETSGQHKSVLAVVAHGRLDPTRVPVVLPGEPVALAEGPTPGTLYAAGIVPATTTTTTTTARRSTGSKAPRGSATTTSTAPPGEPTGYVAEISLDPPEVLWHRSFPNEVTSLAVG